MVLIWFHLGKPGFLNPLPIMGTHVLPLQDPRNTALLAQQSKKNGPFRYLPNSLKSLPNYWQIFLSKIFNNIGGLRLVPFPDPPVI